MKKVVSIIAVLAIATAAQAAVVGSYTSAPTAGLLTTHTTYEITLTADSGDLTGFEVSLTADAANQINPAGASIFEDSNAFFVFVGALEPQDTQFNLLLSEISHVSSSEGTSGVVLAGAFALAGGTGSPDAAPAINIITLCMPNGSSAVLSGKVTVGFDEVVFADLAIPEPASLALLGMGGISMLIRRKR